MSLQRKFAGLLLAATLLTGEVPIDTVELRYLCTFGSKEGIHPPRLANKKAAVAAVGQGEHPYGLGFPVAVATDTKGRIWITDSATSSVHVFDRSSSAYKEFRKLPDATLVQPAGIAADRQGRMYVVDTALANVFVFDENGEFNRPLIKPAEHTLTSPTAITLSEDGRTIYVADPPKNQIVAFNREGEVNTNILLTAAAREPGSLSVIHNQLYVLGAREHRVEIFSPAGEHLGELRWDGIPFPTAFAYDEQNRRFLVANPRLMIVEIFDEKGQGVGAFGQMGEHADQQERIDGLHVDPHGLTYMVDSHHGKVLVFTSKK
jgi:sugar lactone lactonase YvrE